MRTKNANNLYINDNDDGSRDICADFGDETVVILHAAAPPPPAPPPAAPVDGGAGG